MLQIRKHIITTDLTVKQVLTRLDLLASDAILFLVDENERIVASLTDGDIRRGLIKGLTVNDKIEKFVQPNPKYIFYSEFDLEELNNWRNKFYKIIPVVDQNKKIIDIINFRNQRSYLPIDSIIMAGGKGSRLRPLTYDIPKPLLKVGDKPIIEYNIDRLRNFGIKNLFISVKYLGEQIVDCFGNGDSKEMNIQYLKEESPLGTLGSISLVEEWHHEYLLVMNSDLLTNIDFEEMYKELIDKEADMIVASVPYEVKIPYGVLEYDKDKITSLVEKPTYTYYSNAGIYIFKKEYVELIPKNQPYNATDLIEALYSNGKKVVHFPILGYWLDIGKHEDYAKAQNDIKHIKF